MYKLGEQNILYDIEEIKRRMYKYFRVDTPTNNSEVANKLYVDNAISALILSDLEDVVITSVGDNELLAYDSSSQDWINQTPTEAGFNAVATSGNHTDLTAGDGSDHTYINQDVSSTASPTFDDVTLTGKLKANTVTASTTGPTDDFDVGDVNVVLINAGSNSVTIGGFVNGVSGQILHLVVIAKGIGNWARLEHNESTGNQDIFLSSGADETLTNVYGGWTLICDGSNWYEVG